MPVVTISRQYGAGGYTLGKALAERLGWRVVGRDIFTDIAQKAGVSLKCVELAEKEAGSLLSCLINEVFSQAFAPRQVKESWLDLTEDKYLDCVRSVMQELAARGDVVIVGRGGQYILPKRSDIVKVLLVAELEDRIKFLMAHYDLDREKAQQVVQKEEKRRANYLKSFGPDNRDDPGLYNLVINTSHASLKDAEELLVWLVEQAGK
jgi:cytidylate kinase